MFDCMISREEVYRTMGDLIPFRAMPTRSHRFAISCVPDTKEQDKVLSAQIIFFTGVRYHSCVEELEPNSPEYLTCREMPVRQG